MTSNNCRPHRIHLRKLLLGLLPGLLAVVATDSQAQPPQFGEEHLGELQWRFLGAAGPVRALAADQAFPYRVYASQEGGITVRVPHRTGAAAIAPRDWEPTVGAEGGGIVVDPLDAEVAFGTGSDSVSGNWIERRDHLTGERRRVTVWPQAGVYRYARTPPLFFSPHDPAVLYVAGNVLFMTEDEGESWRAISPQLTAGDGGALTSAAESPARAGIFWAGSNDGQVVRSTDFGATWKVVTPPEAPPGATAAAVVPDPHDQAAAYVLLSGDEEAALFRTADHGVTWQVRTAPPGGAAGALLANPQRPGLLYGAGEAGVFLSFDRGGRWTSLAAPTAVTSLLLHQGDLVAATEDRGVWLLDDIGWLTQLRPELLEREAHLFAPRAGYRLEQTRGVVPSGWGDNAPPGVALDLLLGSGVDPSTVGLQILGQDGDEIRSLSLSDGTPVGVMQGAPEGSAPSRSGHRRLWWDLRYAGAPPGMPLGPQVSPGTYLVRLTVGENSTTTQLTVLPDPRLSLAVDATREQVGMLLTLRDQLRRGYEAENRGVPASVLDDLARLAESVAVGQGRPTNQARAVHEELTLALTAAKEGSAAP